MDKEQFLKLSSKQKLVTGGVRNIDSNLCENIRGFNSKLVCMDTGSRNMEIF